LKQATRHSPVISLGNHYFPLQFKREEGVFFDIPTPTPTTNLFACFRSEGATSLRVVPTRSARAPSVKRCGWHSCESVGAFSTARRCVAFLASALRRSPLPHRSRFALAFPIATLLCSDLPRNHVSPWRGGNSSIQIAGGSVAAQQQQHLDQARIWTHRTMQTTVLTRTPRSMRRCEGVSRSWRRVRLSLLLLRPRTGLKREFAGTAAAR